MKKIFILSLISLLFLSACENLTFSNSSTNSVSTSLNISNSKESSTIDNKNNQTTQYLQLFVKAFNKEIEGNYRYYISRYYSKDSVIYDEKIFQKEDEQVWYYENNVIYNYFNNKLDAYIPNSIYSFIKYENVRDSYFLGYEEKNIIRLLEENEIIEENEEYNNYFITSSIEKYEDEDAITIRFTPKLESYPNYCYRLVLSSNNNLFNITNWISSDDYYNFIIQEANKLEFDYEYQFLQKINEYPSQEEYDCMPGFGIDSYADKKYNETAEEINFFEKFINGEEIVYFEITSYPDYGISKGPHITSLNVSDKTFNFNGLTLENSISEIVDFYESIGYSWEKEENLSTQRTIYSFSNGGILISLVTEGEEALSISFSVSISNILGIIY